MLKENLQIIERKIIKSCERAGRNRADITLIAVSKTKPVAMIQELYEIGIRYYGENKVQELADKYELLPKDIHWHMIGHLQRNKIKHIIDKVDLIHSVDSLRLAEAINLEAAKKNCIVNILIEVNMAKEESKFGFMPEDVLENIEIISRLPNIYIKGLMTIAPYVGNQEENRIHFANLRKLSVDIMEKNIDNVNVNVLSMGMSNDYEVAIEEGATMVRVGTALFGERNYSI